MTSSGRRSRVRCGRSAEARVPRASARQRVVRGGRGLLRGHGFAYGPTAAVLRTRALACGPTAARLRAGGARVRASGSRFASAYGRALGHRAAPVCLRRRARPACSGHLPLAPRSAKPSPSPPACRGRHVWRATAHGTCAQRLDALRSRGCGSGLGASGVRDGGVGGQQRVAGPGSPPCLHRRRQASDETPPDSRPRRTCDPLAPGSRSREVRHGSHSAHRTSHAP